MTRETRHTINTKNTTGCSRSRTRTQAARNCARSHESEKKSGKKLVNRARARATIVNKARDVRGGNASRIARHVISWRAIYSEGRGSGRFPWINPWTPHKSPAVSLLFSIYLRVGGLSYNPVLSSSGCYTVYYLTAADTRVGNIHIHV